MCNFLAFGKTYKRMPLCGILEVLPWFIPAGIDQTFAIIANRCKPQAASMAKLEEMRHMLKQVIFTGIYWHQDGKIQNFKETEGYGVKYSYRFMLLCLSHKTNLFNSSFSTCPPLSPCVLARFLTPISFFLSIQSYPVLPILIPPYP